MSGLAALTRTSLEVEIQSTIDCEWGVLCVALGTWHLCAILSFFFNQNPFPQQIVLKIVIHFVEKLTYTFYRVVTSSNIISHFFLNLDRP